MDAPRVPSGSHLADDGAPHEDAKRTAFLHDEYVARPLDRHELQRALRGGASLQRRGVRRTCVIPGRAHAAPPEHGVEQARDDRSDCQERDPGESARTLRTAGEIGGGLVVPPGGRNEIALHPAGLAFCGSITLLPDDFHARARDGIAVRRRTAAVRAPVWTKGAGELRLRQGTVFPPLPSSVETTILAPRAVSY